MKKWFRYVTFPYIWKKSADEKIIERKLDFIKRFEENIQDIIAVKTLFFLHIFPIFLHFFPLIPLESQ